MTKEHLDLATQALDQIEATKHGNVFASRPGIVAAAILPQRLVAFRRVNGVIRMEIWLQSGSTSDVTTDIEQTVSDRAARVLDRL